MAARFLLDTNICLQIRRQRPRAVLARFQQLQHGEAVLSVISYGELVYGAEKSQFREQAGRLLAELAGLLPIMALPPRAGQFYGAIRAALEAKGETIGNNDLWIAAHAQAAELILVTNNEPVCRRVPGLKVENWAAGSRLVVGFQRFTPTHLTVMPAQAGIQGGRRGSWTPASRGGDEEFAARVLQQIAMAAINGDWSRR